MPEKKSQLSVAREEFQQYVRKSVEGARALRDELKLKAQAGTEEAKAHWAELERYFAHLDTVAHDLNQAAGAVRGRRLQYSIRTAAQLPSAPPRPSPSAQSNAAPRRKHRRSGPAASSAVRRPAWILLVLIGSCCLATGETGGSSTTGDGSTGVNCLGSVATPDAALRDSQCPSGDYFATFCHG